MNSQRSWVNPTTTIQKGKKEYSKWIVVLPNEKVEQVGWREGMELDLDAKKGVITLRPKDKNN